MKNLVMGVAKGYGWNDLEPFIVSFKRNCPSAALVLFVDDLSDFTLHCLKSKGGGINLISIPEKLKDKLVINARWEMYTNFIDAHSEYEKIFVTDVRDVLFQDDIFSAYAGCKNFLLYATEAKFIRHESTNTIWIKRFLGEEKYQKIADNPVICCGTVLGSRAEMMNFCENMIEILKSSHTWGDEQAAMNYLVHNKLLPIENLIASGVKSGDIFTVGIVENIEVVGDSVLRGDSGVPAIVHQYTEIPSIIEVVNRIYRADFQPVEGISDVRSSIEQIYCLVQCQNWSMATQFFVNKILYADNLNIHSERLIKLWEFILKKVSPDNFDAEILIAAIQKTIPVAVRTIGVQQIEKIYSLFLKSEKNSALRQFLEGIFFQLAGIFKQNGQRGDYIKYVKLTNEILKE